MRSIVVLAADDFLRGPNWSSVDFLSSPFRWALGIILALVVLAAIIRAAVLLLQLPGADRHKARGIGEAFFFCIIAVFVAFTFQDLFGSLLGSMTA